MNQPTTTKHRAHHTRVATAAALLLMLCAAPVLAQDAPPAQGGEVTTTQAPARAPMLSTERLSVGADMTLRTAGLSALPSVYRASLEYALWEPVAGAHGARVDVMAGVGMGGGLRLDGGLRLGYEVPVGRRFVLSAAYEGGISREDHLKEEPVFGLYTELQNPIMFNNMLAIEGGMQRGPRLRLSVGRGDAISYSSGASYDLDRPDPLLDDEPSMRAYQASLGLRWTF